MIYKMLLLLLLLMVIYGHFVMDDTECPENCYACTDSGTATRCIYDRCKAGYVYKVADGTCNRQFLSVFYLTCFATDDVNLFLICYGL